MKPVFQTDSDIDPATVLEDVQRLLERLVEQGRAPAPPPRLSTVGGSPADKAPGPAVDLQLPTASQVRYRIRQRELRESVFERGLVSDPVWGMLLELLLAHLECRHASVKQVSIASGVPAATAHRHIERLEQIDLLRRYPDPFDGRRTYLALTDEALAKLARLFWRMRENAVMAI